MPYVNQALREISCKIVYCGPGLGGKTTNVQHLYDRTREGSKGRLVSLKTETDRTLFFDFLPLEIGSISGYRTRLQIYTVPGQVFYRASRRLILRGLDGVVFVADSQPERLDANLESLEDLRDNLGDHGRSLDRVPLVLQYNKRDLPGVVPVADLRAALNPGGVPDHEASATTGHGVFETLKTVARMVLLDLNKQRRGSAA
jgi:signal recognition particle receptor subunit beta